MKKNLQEFPLLQHRAKMCIYSFDHVCSETHMAMGRYGGGIMCGCRCASISPILTMTLRVHGSTLRQSQSGEIEGIIYGM